MAMHLEQNEARFDGVSYHFANWALHSEAFLVSWNLIRGEFSISTVVVQNKSKGQQKKSFFSCISFSELGCSEFCFDRMLLFCFFFHGKLFVHLNFELL